MLKVDHIDVFYGAVQALHGVSIEVGDGRSIAVLGSNGAGKSTLLRTVSGMLRCRAGSIEFDDVTLDRKSPADIVRSGIAHVPEGRHIFPGLTIAENLELGAYTRGRGQRRPEVVRMQERIFSLFPRLAERRNQMGGSLSGGEQQMLVIGRALMSLPKLLMLDEPSLGIAPLLVENIYASLGKLRSEGLSLLIVEQNVMYVRKIADLAYVLTNGTVTGQGPVDAMMEQGTLKAAYLGKKSAPNATSVHRVER